MLKMTKNLKQCLMMLICLLLMVIPAFAETPAKPDIIHEMTVDLYPKKDGTVDIMYHFNYEATTPWLKDFQKIQVGVPNSDFDITSFGPKERFYEATPIQSDVSQVELPFALFMLPQVGVPYEFDFAINQRQLLYGVGNELSLEFDPVGFDFAVINHLEVRLHHSDIEPSAVLTEPTADLDGTFVWVRENIRQGASADTITIKYDRQKFDATASFPRKPYSGADGGVNQNLVKVIVMVVYVVLVILINVLNDRYNSGRTVSGFRFIAGFRRWR